MSKKLLKRVIATLCAGVMSMACIANSVGAVEPTGDTKEKEVAFSLKYLDSLPKKGHKDFNKFLNINLDWLNSNRKCSISHKDGKVDRFKMNEEQVYSDIRQEVERIEKKVDNRMQEGRVGGNLLRIANDAGFKVNSDEFSRKMLIAKEIYEWVANNIPYDDESLKKDDKGRYFLMKPQDALFVYEKRIGVCEGKANLINLMMKIAGIPSVSIVTTYDKDGDGHAYNAIFLEDKHNVNRTGWTLLDSTWGASKSDADIRGYVETIGDNRIKKFFPAAYDNKITFREANKSMVRKPVHGISYIYMSDRTYKKLIYDVKIGECSYNLCGQEGNSYISIKGLHCNPVECTIPDDIRKFGLKFKIGDGIKSLIIEYKDTVDLSEATKLESVDITKSDKYIVEKGTWLIGTDEIYEKNKDGSRGKKLDISNRIKVIYKNGKDRLKDANEKFLEKCREYDKWLKSSDVQDGSFKQRRNQIKEYRADVIECYNILKDGHVANDMATEFEECVTDFVEEIDKFMKEYKNDGKFTSVSGYWNYFKENAKRVLF